MSFWIESHQSLARHRKLLRLSALLKCSRVKLVGHLHFLWWWAVDNVGAEGLLGNVTAAEIAMAAEWTGDPGVFVEALMTAGFLDREPFALHDWYEYAGKLLDRRASNRTRMRDARAEHVQRTNAARAEHVHPLPYQPTIPTKKPPKKVVTRVTEINDEFVESMVDRFGRVFGGRARVVELINATQGHKSWAKWTDKQAGVINWLQGDADRIAARGGNGVAPRAPTVRTSEDVEADKAIAEGFRSGRIRDGEPIKLGDILKRSQGGGA